VTFAFGFACLHYLGTVVSFTGKGVRSGHFWFVLVEAGFAYGLEKMK